MTAMLEPCGVSVDRGTHARTGGQGRTRVLQASGVSVERGPDVRKGAAR